MICNSNSNTQITRDVSDMISFLEQLSLEQVPLTDFGKKLCVALVNGDKYEIAKVLDEGAPDSFNDLVKDMIGKVQFDMKVTDFCSLTGLSLELLFKLLNGNPEWEVRVSDGDITFDGGYAYEDSDEDSDEDS